MRLSWTNIKNIIVNATRQDDLYLTLIDEEGTIACANANMLRNLELKNPRSVKTNFFDLLHPGHVDDFKKILKQAAQGNGEPSMELYVLNGHYHPMKWQVRSVEPDGDKNLYFCFGYEIVDKDRLDKFNDLAEKHCRLIMEELTGIIFHDKNGDIIAANQQIANILNSSLERLYQLKDIGKLWDSGWIISNEEGMPVPFACAPFMKALRTGKPHKEILRVRTGNGEDRWMLFNCQYLPGDEESSCYAVSSVLDVTHEKRLAERLNEKKAIISAFVGQTPNLAWIIDEDERLILASTAFYESFGLKESESINRKISELVPAFVYEALYEKHRTVIQTRTAVKFLEKSRMADGTTSNYHINIFPIKTSSGSKLVGGYSVNIPDTKMIEAELREANGRLLTLTRAASNAIWEWDMQTGKIFRNDILMEMIGFQSDDAKGLSWWLRRIHPDDRNRVSDLVKEAAENNQYSWQDEYRFKCADGQYKHIQDKGFVIYENGLPVKMIGSLHDISDLKEMENRLADERIQRQQEISETVIQVQEKERTRIGHELHDNVNQILSTALLFVDTLVPDGKDQKVIKEKSLEFLRTAMEEIRKLSKELVVPQFKEQGLVESIKLLIDDIQFAHPIRIKFTHDLDTDLLSSGKKITLFRIVQEQMKNILKHSEAKNADILLHSRGHEVNLVMRDNGVGFDSKQTRRGIGFSNIYERVSFYNGAVDVQTAPGKGCTVSVSMSLL